MPAPTANNQGLHRFGRAMLFSALLCSGQSWAADAPGFTNVIQTAAEVRSLTSEQAARHLPVKLRGVVTFFDRNIFIQIIQDDTAGIYLPTNNLPSLSAGQLVEVEGVTSPGEFAPVVTAQRITVLGTHALPPAKPVSFEELVSGAEDSQLVEIQGVVRSIGEDPQSQYNTIEIVSSGGRFKALIANIPPELKAVLVDSKLKVRGVCASHFNSQRQLFDVRLMVSQLSDLTIETPAPAKPFALPTRPIEQLLQFTPQGPYGHRVKVRGVVSYRRDNVLYIQDGQEGLYVETEQPDSLLPGDIVEVVGFPAAGDYTPMLQDAIFRKIGDGPAPVPIEITADEALKGTYDCRLVLIKATLLDRARHSREQFLVLQSGGFIFDAYLERTNIGVDFTYLENNTKLAVAGVCRIEPGNVWQPSADWRAKSFRILLFTPADITVLAEPPWWNYEKMLWAMGVLGVVVLVTFTWVAVLRRRVQKQTHIIRQKLQTEAALKERYEDLFENANDMVFTHDLKGRITSINKTGEQLLQRPRHEIIHKRLVDFVVEEQRAAAEQWSAQVVNNTEIQPAEWDFISGTGQRLRMEIGARMIEQEGKLVEVEGIARDVTERKRLEREILEISNREQRRIGHDLHDGVCQLLAGVAYRIDILADQLQEKNMAEYSEAERVGSLINEAITQTRGVARGLFPVQLEENGLSWALEDLATNAGNIFRIKCDLAFSKPFPNVENDAALHLYYIVQEAVLNAAKHGNATQINISLDRKDDRFALNIQDDGSGFETANGNPTGMGIRIMRYRARVIGATLDLKSKPGQGTQVTCIFYSAVHKGGKEAKTGQKPAADETAATKSTPKP